MEQPIVLIDVLLTIIKQVLECVVAASVQQTQMVMAGSIAGTCVLTISQKQHLAYAVVACQRQIAIPMLFQIVLTIALSILTKLLLGHAAVAS
jgi:hypothetical protein